MKERTPQYLTLLSIVFVALLLPPDRFWFFFIILTIVLIFILVLADRVTGGQFLDYLSRLFGRWR